MYVGCYAMTSFGHIKICMLAMKSTIVSSASTLFKATELGTDLSLAIAFLAGVDKHDLKCVHAYFSNDSGT